MGQQRVAVITGVSSGIGRATAAELVQRGFRVFGTVRTTGSTELSGVEHVVLDVRDEQSVKRAVEQILTKTDRIDALVNNAGSGILGAIEETDTAQARELFDSCHAVHGALLLRDADAGALQRGEEVHAHHRVGHLVFEEIA